MWEWGNRYAKLGIALHLFVSLRHLISGICWFLLGLNPGRWPGTGRVGRGRRSLFACG
jgi:hypothetical protein